MTMRKCKFAILAIAVTSTRAFRRRLSFCPNFSGLSGRSSLSISSSPQGEPITRQETLRGSITPEREWWDVLHYHLQVEFLLETKRLRGSNTITFKTLKPGNKMQIDLQPPLGNYQGLPTVTRNSNLNEKEMSTG
jgi:hypothetical protein